VEKEILRHFVVKVGYGDVKTAVLYARKDPLFLLPFPLQFMDML